MSRVSQPLLVALALAAPAPAHEFWIEPQVQHCGTNALVPVRLWVGERFAGAPFVYDDRLFTSFGAYGPEEMTPVRGRSGGWTSYARVQGPGVYVLGYQGRGTLHEMESAAFTAYLHEEGLSAIVDERLRRGEDDRPGRERFIRSAKSLLAVGEGPHRGYDRCIGLPLELVPLDNPFEGGVQAVRFRLLLGGKPLAGAKLVAVNRQDPGDQRVAFTDAEGLATLTVDREGLWLVTSVHMRRLANEPQADWESIWASLTFARSATPVARATGRAR